jgi:hypothetical protein
MHAEKGKRFQNYAAKSQGAARRVAAKIAMLLELLRALARAPQAMPVASSGSTLTSFRIP